jgi:hypothetical protein
MTDNALAKRNANALRMRQAIEDREAVRMRYYGGSQPNAQRSIMPLRIEGEDAKMRVMGMDQATGLPKNYTLDRLDTLSADEPEESMMYVGSEAEKQKARDYRQKRSAADPLSSLQQLAQKSGYTGNNIQEAMGVVWRSSPTDDVAAMIEAIASQTGLPPPWMMNEPAQRAR